MSVVRTGALLAALLVSASLTPTPGPAQETPRPSVFFLVRHAERAGAMIEDPPLTDRGRDRAELLGRMLGDAELDAVWSTDWIRTRRTAEPTARRAGLEVRLYDPSDLDAFADTLRSGGGRALVVGHSDTTPALVRALGGDPGPPLGADEYDRLYVIVAPRGGPVSTVLLHFGPTDGT